MVQKGEVCVCVVPARDLLPTHPRALDAQPPNGDASVGPNGDDATRRLQGVRPGDQQCSCDDDLVTRRWGRVGG